MSNNCRFVFLVAPEKNSENFIDYPVENLGLYFNLKMARQAFNSLKKNIINRIGARASQKQKLAANLILYALCVKIYDADQDHDNNLVDLSYVQETYVLNYIFDSPTARRNWMQTRTSFPAYRGDLLYLWQTNGDKYLSRSTPGEDKNPNEFSKNLQTGMWDINFEREGSFGPEPYSPLKGGGLRRSSFRKQHAKKIEGRRCWHCKQYSHFW